MKKKNEDINLWRALSILLIIILIVENVWLWGGYIYIKSQEDRTNRCFYDVCSDYEEASFERNVCTCYDKDVLGKWALGKTKYMP